MNLENNTHKGPPTVIADLDGKIIYVDEKVNALLLGISVGDNIDSYLAEEYINRGGVQIIKTKNLKLNTAVLQTVGEGVGKTIEMQLWNVGKVCPENRACDKKLFDSFSEIAGKAVYAVVNLNTLVHSIVDCIKTDLRYSYRRIEIDETEEEPWVKINVAQVSTALIGIISILNEIEYRNVINVSVERMLDRFVLNFSVAFNAFCSASGALALAELNPRAAMRIAYVTAICSKSDINCDFDIKPNKVSAQLSFTSVTVEGDKLSASIYEGTEKSYVSCALDLFNYYLFSDTEGEEQE